MIEFKGPIAFAAVVTPSGRYGLGVAVQDESGYHPYEGVVFPSFDAAWDAARDMNDKLGLTPKAAMLIVASSMRSDGRRARGQVRS